MSDSKIFVTIDGTRVDTHLEQSVGALLHDLGKAIRRSPRLHQPRSIFCGIGSCFECRVTVDGRPGVRACITPVREGMTVETEA